ncbi:MAG: CDC48 family AAA ATPase [Nitrososphaerales archaeon]
MVKKERALSLQLKVVEAKQRDIGKKRARISNHHLKELGIKAGSVIEIIGKKVTPVIAWPLEPEEDSLEIIRLDGQTRKNAGTALNEYVTIRKSKASVAKSITLVPLNSRLRGDKDFTQFIKNRLKGYPFVEGDEISLVILGNPVAFIVDKVRPKGIVKIAESSKLILIQEPSVSKGVGLRVTYDEIGGLKEEISKLREIVELPLRHPELFHRLGIEPPKGILLYGPPGCGKTLIAKALANESEAKFYSINGPEIMSKYYGETEAKLREIFKDAKENAPSIIFLDEIDAIAPKREETFGDVEKRLVAQLLALMDGLTERGRVIVIGATNRADSLDPALRRPGRFDREVEIGVPNTIGRLEILQIHTRGMPLGEDVDLLRIAREAHGFTGADLRALCAEAALKALRRYLPELDLESEKIPSSVLEKMVVKNEDFREAFKEIVPTALREFYIENPNLGFEDVGGLMDVKKTLEENLIWAIKNPERFQKIGIEPPKGILLYGPPGCGKTLIAKALARECGTNFITVRGPEILSKWVGESEKAIREIFKKAKSSAPCIIFLDEIDSIARIRGDIYGDFGVSDKVLSQLLTEMDSISNVEGLFVVAATNRADVLDPSLLRPGRLDLLIYVPPPNEEERKEILNKFTSKMPKEELDLKELAKLTKGYSGADLEALCREAGIIALKKDEKSPLIRKEDFLKAMEKVKPSITEEILAWYESQNKRIISRISTQKGFYG